MILLPREPDVIVEYIRYAGPSERAGEFLAALQQSGRQLDADATHP
jgi:hypothetical protein